MLELRVVFAAMTVVTLYAGTSVWRFLRTGGVSMPLTGYAASAAFLLDVSGSVLSFFVPGEWVLKTIFVIAFFLWCMLFLVAIGVAAGAPGAFPGVVLF